MRRNSTTFRPTRRTLMYLLPCLLALLSMFVDPAEAQTQSTDGRLDSSFQEAPMIGPQGSVQEIAFQADGKIIVGGYFTSVNGVSGGGLARLNPNGSVDPTFVPASGSSGSSLALQPDGKILTSGEGGVLRLNPDGSLDPSFTQYYMFGGVDAIALQPDGKILAASRHNNPPMVVMQT